MLASPAIRRPLHQRTAGATFPSGASATAPPIAAGATAVVTIPVHLAEVVPQPASLAQPPSLAGIYLTVQVGNEAPVTRVIAGYASESTPPARGAIAVIPSIPASFRKPTSSWS